MMQQNDRLFLIIEDFKTKDRRALAKAITIMESQEKSAHVERARLLKALSPLTKKNTLRVAISGPPGVGKSTFINAFGQLLVEQSFSVAILPIDPSSDETMGSILADKTRMGVLAKNQHVYIRPSPSKGNLGGVTFTTPDVIFLVEAFGFDVVIIETVGVGQSETMAKYLSDHFVVLLQPGSGDQLQAMKKGILEKADFILINKADEEQKGLAHKTLVSLKALNLGHKHGKEPYVKTISALKNYGIDDFFEKLLARHRHLSQTDELANVRQKNLLCFFDYSFDQIIGRRLRNLSAVLAKREKILTNLAEGIGFSPVLHGFVQDICDLVEANGEG